MHAFCVCIRRPHTRGMAISLLQRRPVGAPPDGPAGRSGRSAGVAMMLASGLSNQVGAAVGALAFPVIGPAGVVAVRQWVAGVALLAIGRPRVRSYTWRQWWPVLSLALVFATMNLSLYTAIDRIGLGLAVTLEFLGPLSVALAGSRRRVDLVCALLAGAAVAVLARPEPTTDYLGIGLGLLAAVCWACYILLNRVIGRRLPGAGDRRLPEARPAPKVPPGPAHEEQMACIRLPAAVDGTADEALEVARDELRLRSGGLHAIPVRALLGVIPVGSPAEQDAQGGGGQGDGQGVDQGGAGELGGDPGHEGDRDHVDAVQPGPDPGPAVEGAKEPVDQGHEHKRGCEHAQGGDQGPGGAGAGAGMLAGVPKRRPPVTASPRAAPPAKRSRGWRPAR